MAKTLQMVQPEVEKENQEAKMTAYRQGDVVILAGATIPKTAKVLPHRVLAEGEVTGHKHQITDGQATLYAQDGILYLRVMSDTATLTHEEHAPIVLPQGEFQVVIQREYEPAGWRHVAD